MDKSKKCLDKSHHLVQKMLRPKFIWKSDADSCIKKFVEMTLNIAYVSVENGCLSWSQWLIFTDEGKHLTDLMLSKDSKERFYGISHF